jgi:AcrR family transcriptional regulator
MGKATSGQRAPGLSPQLRREAILRAALPLVVEHGTTVTTQQIARAAGIGEATIFRVFTDKNELLQACVAEVLDPTRVLQDLQAISLDLPLASRLTEAAERLSGFLVQMSRTIGALHASGHHQPHRRAAGTPREPVAPSPPAVDQDALQIAVHRAVAVLIAPDEAVLRRPIGVVTDVFLRLLVGHSQIPGSDELRIPVEEFVDLFLHGALTSPEPT